MKISTFSFLFFFIFSLNLCEFFKNTTVFLLWKYVSISISVPISAIPVYLHYKDQNEITRGIPKEIQSFFMLDTQLAKNSKG